MAAKITVPASTTVKVATLSGAAKDDLFTGLNEDNANKNLYVLANDPGSAKLWSLDQNALNAPAGSQLPGNLNLVTLASGASISANADGSINYSAGQSMQSLAEGEIFRDSFIYVIRMANGALSTARAVVEITGVNDAATFSGDSTGSLSEDDSSVGGVLTVSDLDHDQSSMQAAVLAGAFGSLGIDTAGNWSYALQADMNYLAEGESLVEQFTVRSLDGTEQQLAITISGVNDVAEFSGDSSGSVQEDGVLTASGVLSVSDADHDQSAFASSGNLQGNYGDFTFDLESGAWTYALRKGDQNVQALASGQSVQDILQLVSIDGSTTAISINIGGQDEAVSNPDPVNPAVKWVVNRHNVTSNNGGLDSQVNYDVNGVARILNFDSNDMLNSSSLNQDSPFVQLVDTDAVNGVDSTLLNFSYTQSQQVIHLDVILVGYLNFSMDQLVH